MKDPEGTIPPAGAPALSRVRRGLALAGLALGCAHMAFALPALRALTPDVVWFIGSGLAIIVASLSNLNAPSLATLAQNLLTAAFFALAWTVIGEPQTIAGAALFLALAALHLARRRAPDA